MKSIVQIENTSLELILDAVKSIFESKINELTKEVKELQNLKGVTEDDYVTAKETAKILHITPATLWAWENQGKVKKYRVGKRVYYKRSEINDLIAQSNTKG